MTCGECKDYWIRVWNDQAQDDGYCQIFDRPTRSNDLSCTYFVKAVK